jgi:antitoxin ParD1/3/4
MTKVAIILTDELQRFIDRSVKSGSYHNPSEVVANALHGLKAQEDFEHGKLALLRKEIAIGTGQADQDKFVEFNAESIKAEGRRRLLAYAGE